MTVPRYLFGAREQADHALRLLQWLEQPIEGIELFEDGYPATTTGAADLPIRGTLADGEAICAATGGPALVAMGSKGAARRYGVLQRLDTAHVDLASVISQFACVAPTARLGLNVVLMPGVVVAKGARIGSLACVFSNSVIEHDAILDDNVTIGPGVSCAGHVRIGRHAFLGAGATVCPHVTIGERAILGAGAVAIGDVPPGVVAVGIPARPIRDVRHGDDAPTLEDLERFCEANEVNVE